MVLSPSHTLYFDFDGVLLDSLNEVTVTAWNCVTGERRHRISSLPPGFVELIRKHRHLAQPAWELFLLGEWCLSKSEHPESSLSSAEFLTLKQVNRSRSAEMRASFFATRAEICVAFPDEWLALNAPYEPLWSALRPYSASFSILTNKNRSAILHLCTHFGLNIDPDRIISGDSGVPKGEQLHSRIATSDSPILFFDDQIDNLEEVRHSNRDAAGLRCFLATWGYCSSEDIRRAEAAGIEAVSQTQVAQMVEESLG